MIQEVKLRLVKGALQRVLADILLAASDTVTAGAINSVYLGLITDPAVFNLDLIRTDLTEATYDGYARQLVVWGTPGVDGSNRPEVLGGSLTFSPTGPTTASTIKGVAMYDASTVGTLLGVGFLNPSVTLAVAADDLAVIPKVAVPGIEALDWGAFGLLR